MDKDQMYAANKSLFSVEEEDFDNFYKFFEKWSLNCGSLLGIPIRIHISNILWLILIFYVSGYYCYTSIPKYMFILLVLFVLLSHEMCHAIVARHYGNIVQGVFLILPLGALAFIRLNNDKPLERLAISLAGPIVNLFTAFVIFMLSLYFQNLFYSFFWKCLLRALFEISLVVGIFNLIPLYPLDGGRVVKDLLLLCKAGYKLANMATLGVSVVSFAFLLLLSIKTDDIYLFIIAIVIMICSVNALWFSDNYLKANLQ